MKDDINKLADKRWPEMMQALDKKGADVAYDIFIQALKDAYDLY